jgi:hypothetical protein
MSADMAALVAAWPGLPEVIRVGIVAMVKAASRSDRATAERIGTGRLCRQ